MDKRTRVFHALDKQEVDHVPVGFWYHFAGEQAVGEGCVQAHADYVRRLFPLSCSGRYQNSS